MIDAWVLPWLPAERLAALSPGVAAMLDRPDYPCTWRDNERTQVFVWNTSACVIVPIDDAEWATLPRREYLVE